MKPPTGYKEELHSVIELLNTARNLKFSIWKEYVVFTGHWIIV